MRWAFDPGITTGFAVCNEEGVLQEFGQIKYNDLHKFLDDVVESTHFIIEGFRIRPNHNFAFDEMKTIRVIGALEYRAHQLGAKTVMQDPPNKSIGYKWAGITVPKDHKQSHQTDAYAHLVYYNVKQLKMQPPVAQRIRNETA